MKRYYMGIDTSNYTSSIAIVDENNYIIFDERIILEVKQGNRGLRQSEALFQHINNLPTLVSKMSKKIDVAQIKGVSVSSQPRTLADSYMPVFLGGMSFGKVLATTLKCPYYEFSHQEGHIRAALYNQNMKSDRFNAIHMSGGTTEILSISKKENYEIDIIGGTKDISIGQLIDRIGVKLGLQFPCGKELDSMACNFHNDYEKKLKKISINHLNINLSGIESQSIRLIQDSCLKEALVHELFSKIADLLITIINNKENKEKDFLLMGGVASSQFIRKVIEENQILKNSPIYFAKREYAVDNAVGTALLGKEKEEG